MNNGIIVIKNDVYDIDLKIFTSNLSTDMPAVNFLYILKKSGVTYAMALLSDFTYRLYSREPHKHFSKGSIESLCIMEHVQEEFEIDFKGLPLIQMCGHRDN